MDRITARMKELEGMAEAIREAPDWSDFIGLADRKLLVRLLEKHMESLKQAYQGRIRFLLQEAINAYFYHKTQRDGYLARFMLEPDERRYVEAVWAQLDDIEPVDYMPREED